MINNKLIKYFSLFFVCLNLCSCISYRIGTLAQEGSELQTYKAKSLFWGLIAGPPQIPTPLCDSLASNGMSELRLRRSGGQVILSLVTLGIVNNSTIEYKCGKPCAKTADPI
jgi:hypothetical protein